MILETLTPFIAYSLALFLAAIIPGPGIAALVGRSLGSAGRGSLSFISGMILGDLFYLTLVVLGLSVVAKAFSGVFIVIKLLGGLYLLYLAYQLWTSQSRSIGVKSDISGGNLVAVTNGFIVTLGNPKAIIFYMALVPNVIDLSQVGVFEWAILSLLTATVLVFAFVPYALVSAKAVQLLSSGEMLKRLNRGAAIFIGGAGLAIVIEAIYSFYSEITHNLAIVKAKPGTR